MKAKDVLQKKRSTTIERVLIGVTGAYLMGVLSLALSWIVVTIVSAVLIFAVVMDIYLTRTEPKPKLEGVKHGGQGRRGFEKI